MCGEEFGLKEEALRHQDGAPDHVQGTARVTTDYPNQPVIRDSTAPTLTDEIKLLYCTVDCPASPNDASKVDQYISKCQLCKIYRCLLCAKFHSDRYRLLEHVTAQHEVNPLAPVSAKAVSENHWLINLSCQHCKCYGTAIRGQHTSLYNLFCRFCGVAINTN
ncbi:hypothetical protein EB796_013573 [Bugula neritina]|uniref:Uncharacterized protein n=1 Tax=Bugula neritina TaxID=10212 RepID=A0A7J7JQG6_BUGNE|nr:hypothetical protein EB796_013573 [Bugula neritina]